MATQAAEDLASLAGFTVAFFNSDPGLKSLFSKALAENWTGDRLLQAARNTKWFKTHTDAEREAQLLNTSDPATYKANATDMNLRVVRLATELGMPLGTKMRQTTTRLALNQGWDDERIRAYLGQWKTVRNAVNQGAVLGGQIGLTQDRIGALARANGIRLSRGTEASWLQSVASGALTEQHIVGNIQKLAASAFPGLADRINSGETVADIAAPFVQTMAKLWEVSPEGIDMFNTTLRGALNTKGQDGKFSMMTLPEFETKLRKDPRWNATDNAQDSLMQAGHEVLQQWGITW
jgi:hypothetical protein